MLPYAFLGGLSALCAVLDVLSAHAQRRVVWLLLPVVFSFLFIGLRYEVGGDWPIYAETYRLAQVLPFREALMLREPGFMLINLLPAQFDIAGLWGVHLLSAALICGGLARFCMDQEWPALTFCAAMPYFIAVVCTGYARQSVAIGCTLFAISALRAERPVQFVLWCILAASFHKTAVAFAAIGLLSAATSLWLSLLITALLLPPLYYIFLMDALDRLGSLYIGREYGSSGALYRTAQLFLCGAVYLVFLRPAEAESNLRRFWTICAGLSLLALPAALVGPSSTMVDRFGLFLLPLQFYMLGVLPARVCPREHGQFLAMLIVVLNLAMLALWLSTATRLTAYIPYRSYLWPDPADQLL